MTNNVDGSPLEELTPEDGDSDPDQRLQIDCVHEAGDWGPSLEIELLAAKIAAAIPHVVSVEGRGASAALALLDDATVRRLNAAYRNQDKPTNVLSFPAASRAASETSHRFLGDVALACETIRSEARQKGIPFRDHVGHLVVHGVLHLLGYDHGTDAEAATMERAEVEVLARLAIPDPFLSHPNEEVFDRPA